MAKHLNKNEDEVEVNIPNSEARAVFLLAIIAPWITSLATILPLYKAQSWLSVGLSELIVKLILP